jgi:eukaryotic-like serine/threonine-protein kinase
MNSRSCHDPSMAPGLAARLDAARDCFEEQLIAGGTPRPEDFLPMVDEADRPALLRELLTLEQDYRGRRGAQAGPENSGSSDQSTVKAGSQAEVDPRLTKLPSVGASSSSGVRFRILRPHAKGGLGQVSIARDEELPREVALKEIQNQYADNPASRARFLLEAEITGGLEHPGIVPVYGLGQYADGRPFYAMRFIRGDSLKDAIDRFYKDETLKRDPGKRTLKLRQLLQRFIDVCEAMQYAHDRGVLHRDLKPGNIMLGKYGETLIVDWGLAKPLGKSAQSGAAATEAEEPLQPKSVSGSSATLPGSALGTPAYMSPEQAVGRLDQMGPASDVYSLGATLYCVLTGKAPIEDRDFAVVLKKVQHGNFPKPRQLNPNIDPALEAICVKAMAVKPAGRYASPLALAKDLELWLADEPVAAGPAGIARWRPRWLLRCWWPWWRQQQEPSGTNTIKPGDPQKLPCKTFARLWTRLKRAETSFRKTCASRGAYSSS